jgi:hypothetical protein
MKEGELWTMALHQPVDTRELDRLGREILKAAASYVEAFDSSTSTHNSKHNELLGLVRRYQKAVMEMVLREPDFDA